MSKKETSRFSGKPLGIECHDCVSTNNQMKGKSPMGTITMGVDLAKQVFSVAELDGSGRVRQRRDLKRESFAAWLGQQPPGTIVAMEACSSAHNGARRCLEHGLVPRLMAAQFVKPFRKSQANKNDPRAWANPMNERGLRVRFLPWSGSATPIQQDRLRKCSLATLRSPNTLASGKQQSDKPETANA